MAREKTRAGVSIHPEDAVDAGLWMGGDAVVDEAVFTEYDYGGTVKRKQLPVVLLITYRHAEGTYEQPYSCGDGWDVEKGGDILIPMNGQKGLSKSCNALQFFKSLEGAGYDLADLDESVHALEGQGVVCSRQAQPDRDNFQPRGRDRDRGGNQDRDRGRDRRDRDGRDDKKSYILIDDLLDKAPKFGKGKADEKPKGRSKSRDDDEDEEKPARSRGRASRDEEEDEKPTRTKRAAKDEDDDDIPSKGRSRTTSKATARDEDDDTDTDDLDEEAEDALVEVLEKAPKQTLKVGAVEEAVYTHLKGHPKRKAIAERAADEDFMAGLKKAVKTDGKTVVLK